METGAGSMRYFGVKSHLDNFHDRQSHNTQDENLRDRYLIPSTGPRFSSRWWKILLWFGSFLVLFGFCLLSLTFFLPRKKIHIDSNLSFNNSQIIIIDRQAIAYNTNLDTSHLFGICLIVAGGILFALSLLIPTFCYMWCDNEDLNDETESLKLRMKLSNDEQSIPVGSVLKSVQPNYYQGESIVP